MPTGLPAVTVMRVAIYSKPFWPSMGGVETSSHTLARALLEELDTGAARTKDAASFGPVSFVPGER